MKSYTDIEQSKKLAEILPLESADMHYCLEERGVATGYEIGITPFIKVKEYKGKCNVTDVQPAWSLAALIGVLPRSSLHQTKDGEWYCNAEPNRLYFSRHYDNPVDACYEMIIKLSELKML